MCARDSIEPKKKWTSNSLKPRFVHQNRTSNLLQKAQTSNLFGQKRVEARPKYLEKPKFEFFWTQVFPPNPNYEPKPSKNPELQAQELGLTHHMIQRPKSTFSFKKLSEMCWF